MTPFGKSTVKRPGIAVKTDPELWAEAKRKACEDAKLCKHSARKMQWATKYYKKEGGKYEGPKRRDNKLATWSRQDWTTSSGAKSEGRRRYLPKEAWDALTPDQIRRTNEAKAKGFRKGRQWVKQPKDVAEVAARVRHSKTFRSGNEKPTDYPWLSYAAAHQYEEEAENNNVSKVARGKGGFMRMYEKYGEELPERRTGSERIPSETWRTKRFGFIQRFLPTYEKKRSRRLWLAFRMWAYQPPGEIPPSEDVESHTRPR